MPHIAKEVESYLLTVAAITDVIGQRIYRNTLRQNCDLPAIVLTTFGGDSPSCLSGQSAGLAQVRLQIECFAATDDAAWALAELVRRQSNGGAGLQGYRGTMGETFVHSSERAGDATLEVDQPAAKSDERRWVATTDYLIYHAEAV